MSGARPDTWMPFFIGDYLADTMHLEGHEHGAYLLLLFAYWRGGGALPDDDRRLAAIARVQPKHWQAMRPTIAEFFEVSGGLWWHKRVEGELASASERMDKQRARTAAATEARRRQRNDSGDGDVTSNVTSSSSPSPSPSPSPEEESTLSGPQADADIAFTRLWAGWQIYETAKGSRKKAQEDWRRHVVKLGVDVEMVLAQARAYCDQCQRTQTKTASVFRWLKHHRWEDDHDDGTDDARRRDIYAALAGELEGGGGRGAPEGANSNGAESDRPSTSKPSSLCGGDGSPAGLRGSVRSQSTEAPAGGRDIPRGAAGASRRPADDGRGADDRGLEVVAPPAAGRHSRPGNGRNGPSDIARQPGSAGGAASVEELTDIPPHLRIPA